MSEFALILVWSGGGLEELVYGRTLFFSEVLWHIKYVNESVHEKQLDGSDSHMSMKVSMKSNRMVFESGHVSRTLSTSSFSYFCRSNF